MIIYNKIWLNNLKIQQQVDTAREEGCITGDEVKHIKEKYPVGFYMPGIIIRIGLFVLTCIIILFSVGLLSLLLLEGHVIDGFGWPLFLGITGYVILEVMVNQKHYYRSGVDDALLYITAGLITGSFIWMLGSLDTDYSHSHYWGISIFEFILSLYLTLRFADLLMSLITTLSFLAIVFFSWKILGQFGLATLPFIMLLTSAFIYVIIRRLYNKVKWYYKHCLVMMEVVSLITLYMAGNYYIVQTLSNQLNGIAGSGASLPFGWFFWLWTLLLPFAYIIGGLIKKDMILLRTGLMLIAGTVFTFRYYYYILSPEIALTLAGLVLLAVVYMTIKRLKKPKHGFTLAEKSKATYMDNIKIESLLIGRTFGHTHTAPPEQTSRFGGGSFGGGGSSSTY